MSWRNEFELSTALKGSQFAQHAGSMYCLNQFYRASLPSSDYISSPVWRDAIALTDEGRLCSDELRNRFPEADDGEIAQAIFLTFYHQILLVDAEASDRDAIRELLGSEITLGKIRHPWIFGLNLYDRFFELFPQQTDVLLEEDANRLISGTMPGVFQLLDFVVGPFGVLQSHTHRYIRPILNPALWSCSDPACQALHDVRLTPHQPTSYKMALYLARKLNNDLGPASEWHGFFSKSVLRTSGEHYDDLSSSSLPWLLGNSFSLSEMQAILRHLIEHGGRPLRRRFPDEGAFKRLLTGSGSDISSRLNESQCLQLILVCSDEEIVRSIESCIEKGAILVPATETRTARITTDRGGWFRISGQCSSLGVRFVPTKRNYSIARLRRMVKHVYERNEDIEALAFRVRHSPGDTLEERLDSYLFHKNPRDVIRDLVFVGPNHINAAFENLRFGLFEVPNSEREEEAIISKMLWKLGFNIQSFPAYLPTFWRRLEQFLESSRTYSVYSDSDRERIRSAGANLFVSLEELLDYSLSFSTWALLSDHYLDTRFRFELAGARRFMAEMLGGRSIGSDTVLELDSEGQNTLFPLTEGFSVLCSVCDDYLENHSRWDRPREEMPGFAKHTDLEEFPFAHTALILDLREEDRLRLLALIDRISGQLNRANVSNVRNRIEHNRPDFPSQEEIETVVSALTATIREMETSGICPVVYSLSGSLRDAHGRGTLTLRDYRDRELVVREPSQYNTCKLPTFTTPTIVVPWMHVGHSIEFLRFTFVERSPYLALWENYPKRRPRLGANHSDSSAVETIGADSDIASES